MALISAILFLYTLFFKTEIISLNNWNFISCQVKKNWTLHTTDCLFTREKSVTLSYPLNTHRKVLNCFYEQNTPLMTKLNSDPDWVAPKECQIWKSPKKIPDIGWDSYQVWYARALIIYENSKRIGIARALIDWDSFEILKNNDYLRYPWFVSQVYAVVLWFFSTPHPFLLQILQLLVMLGCALLFYRLRNKEDKYLWISFALAPISARFMFYTYADLWLIFVILFMWWCFENRKIGQFIMGPLILAACFIKEEAYVQILVFASTWFYLNKDIFHKIKSVVLIFIIFYIIGLSVYFSWAAQFPVSANKVALTTRLLDTVSWTHRLPQILGYYADVYFRFAFWGMLIINFLYLLWKIRKNTSLVFACIPYFSLVAIIPIAFLSFPDGTYREVVLTGANRALWQLLPLLFLLTTSYHCALVQKKNK